MTTTHPLLAQLSHLSPQDFAAFGLGHVAYVRPVEVDGETAFSIHAADGTPLSVMPERDVAFAAVRQNDMEPLSVH
ncbi:DUF1150 family protein [Azospirillum agricola]|uniref:DUF1150 family protein n=1 Tax=Azospirillum agricola TaxID=1720247 RepID=UPI000A0F14C5|nr:DUF1150 family protein [Azospirillum agricola]MBP2228245.1 hypothetical protein [Azospirillum agricola]SMH54503.1 hypothetical protein SAMN02982994_3616 [Azospirillum lipoferum]